MEDLRSKGEEWELTDAVQNMIDLDRRVLAVLTDIRNIRIDVGRVETYTDAFRRI
jgi:dTDP-glucose pyrophosphorylase